MKQKNKSEEERKSTQLKMIFFLPNRPNKVFNRISPFKRVSIQIWFLNQAIDEQHLTMHFKHVFINSSSYVLIKTKEREPRLDF